MREARWEEGWFRVPHQVSWRDLDGLGHVNNAVFFTYFEWARTMYWLQLRGKTEPGPESIEFIVARAECDFRMQLGLAEEIEILVRIGAIRNSSFDFLYEIRKAATGELAATGLVVAVHFDWSGNRKLAVGSDLKRAIRVFQKEEEG